MAQRAPALDDSTPIDGPVVGGRRHCSRLRVRLPARLVTHTETRRVILADLSLTGARLLTQGALRDGQEAVLEWDRHEAFGAVVWQEGPACGLLFFDPIDEATLMATRGIDDAARLPQDRELVRQIARQWVEGATRL